MSLIPTELKDLVVGDVIATDVTININDTADPNSKSGTARK
jgi:hypothetical protein